MRNTDIEIVDAVLSGRGISSFGNNTNGALVSFSSYIDNYYDTYFYDYETDDDYEVAKSIVAFRFRSLWLRSLDNANNIVVCILNFLDAIDKTMQKWYESPNMSVCYEIALKDIVFPFIETFNIDFGF